MFDKLLVAVDGSEHAKSVLNAASELATKLGSSVRVLHVLEMGFAGRAGQVPLEEREPAQKILDNAVAELESQGVKATSSLRAAQHGRVAGEIDDEAREWGADGIVTGSRGLSEIEGLLVGSTTHKLLHITNLPVVVVR